MPVENAYGPPSQCWYSVRAAVATEAVFIDAGRMREVIARNPDIRNALDARYLQHLQEQ